MLLLGIALVLVAVFSDTGAWVAVGGFVLIVVGFAMYSRVGVVHGPPVTIGSPVRGRWLALNSPASKVPSHGVLAMGQSHAIDLVHEPTDGELPRPTFGDGPGMRPPTDFPGFGQPILAPSAGRVVRAVDSARDHRSRSSWGALLYMVFVEGFRELGGSRGVMGNHLVIEVGPRQYVALAHLRRTSLRVRRGDRVEAGQHVADCGNSGNTSEPHVHVQVMESARPAFAAGLPMTFEPDGVPVNGEAREF